jgi:hypothetical protein
MPLMHLQGRRLATAAGNSQALTRVHHSLVTTGYMALQPQLLEQEHICMAAKLAGVPQARLYGSEFVTPPECLATAEL